MDFTKEFRLLSLCSGYGGIELGLKRIIPALRTVAYVEVEAFAVANLVTKMEKGQLDVAPIWTDIKTFDGRPFYKRVHIITAGYPCQPFSVAGKQKGTDDPRHLWPYIERIIEAVRPVWFFGENVSGHLAIGFPEVYRSLRNLGYTVETRLFTAAECGAPHRRERLFILAYARSPKSRRLSNCQQKEDSTIRSTSQMADTENPNGGRTRRKANNRRGHKEIGGQNNNQWPARPGQPQYEWEEPRVVGNSTSKRQCGRQKDRHRRPAKVFGQGFQKNENKGHAQSRLGRAANGTSCRVDRLRLLGNGVVPQQAEKAFRSLYEQLSE